MTTISKSTAIVACLAGAMLAHASAQASDANGNFALRGYGSRSCEAFLVEFPDATHADKYGSWLMGYATARNRLESDTFDVVALPDGAVLLQAVAAVCADQKNLTVELAANEVVRVTAPLHQRGSSPVLTVEADGRTQLVRQATLQTLQLRLAERKLYSGPTDGQWSAATAVAIMEFQSREKIAVTGMPDFATLLRAFVL